MKQILFVGLGVLGTSLASFLLAREHPLTMWDSDATRIRPIPARRIVTVNACDVLMWPPETPLPDVVVHCYSLADLTRPDEVAKTYMGAPYALVTRFPKARHVYISSYTAPSVRAFAEGVVQELVRAAKRHTIVYVPQIHGLCDRTEGVIDSLNPKGCVIPQKTVTSIDGNELLPMLEEAILYDATPSLLVGIHGRRFTPDLIAGKSGATYSVADVVPVWYDQQTEARTKVTKTFRAVQETEGLLAVARARAADIA